MANTRQKLETRGVIMTLLSLVLMNMGCEDKIDSPAVNPSEGKTVEVALNIGFADETDGYNLSASTKALPGEEGAFSMELTPTITTRALDKPDALYKLEIRQYRQDGTYLNGSAPADQTIGKKLTVNLAAAEDCQLVFVAWGQNSQKSLGGIDLPKAQEIAIDASAIKSITDTDMNKMPYILHLKHVNVTGSGASGVISSPNGEDVRILLKRLATRLTLKWEYSYTDYSLKQILLESIPLNYKVIPKPDENENNTYPSLVDQYTTIQLSAEEVKAESYTCWIPANVRGTNNESNSPLYRIKANAPTGSSYASFIAGHDTDVKKKLNYRVYLGGSDYTDFNLYGNTDYSYTVNFKHTELPVNDRRVTIIDPIPAYENNENLVPTANCFMVAPGGAFCFDPFKYQIDGSGNNVNTTLKGWTSSGGIAYVRVLWQTKENGDLGDPVLGVVNNSDKNAPDHTNIVDIKRNDGKPLSASPLTDADQGRIYCRVAPNTTGGNGVIAAYNAKNEILWSWHIWVTDYSPDPTGNHTVLSPENKRKQKYTYRADLPQYPMMDRNLGAKVGYIDAPKTELDKSKANGLHYQWGRKDPLPGSFSEKQITIVNISTTNPTIGLLNMYQPDGITFYPRGWNATGSCQLRDAYKTPTVYYGNWIYVSDSWSLTAKSLHDPCPAGWKVASKTNYYHLFAGDYNGSVDNNDKNAVLNVVNSDKVETDGGFVLCFESGENGNTSYFRLTGYQRNNESFQFIGKMSNLWCREYSGDRQSYSLTLNIKGGLRDVSNVAYNWTISDAHNIRCIQERE